MIREHDAHFTGLYVAQCARRGAWTTGTGTTAATVNTGADAAPSGRASADAAPGNQTVSAAAAQAARQAMPAAAIADGPIPLERDVLAGVLKALALHRRVAWAHRMNVGAFTNGAGQFVRVGFVGCPDIIGQLVTGEFLAVECKRPGGKPTADQAAFLGRVQRAGGVAFVAWAVDDVARGLAQGPEAA